MTSVVPSCTLIHRAGQERFQSITNRFYSDSHAVVIVYDMTSEDAPQDLDFWVREIQYYLPLELEAGMPVLFVANKKDLIKKEDIEERRQHFRQAQEVSHSNGFLPPVQCSAKTGENVDKVFQVVAEHLVRNRSGSHPLIRQTDQKRCTACSS